jgi:Kef-type K+ transport system membrane component KefB
MENLFVELTVVLVLAGGCALLVSFLKQPSIMAYILAGLILGPFGYWRLHQGETLHALSQIGITLLLFMVGMELDVTQLKKIGRRALLAGVGQVLITTLIGFLVSLALHFSVLTALYIGLALTFSSTIIVVKLLTEKRDLQSLYGRLVVGIFLTQDFIALVILMILSSGNDAGSLGLPLWGQIAFTLLKGLLLVLAISGLSTYVFPRLLKIVGKSDELLLVFSLAWALGFAVFVQLPAIGFTLEIGGFLAGLALSSSSLHHEISARIRSLRDFFIMILFIVLGSQVSFVGLTTMLLPALLLSAFVLIGNPLIVLIILSLLGYKPRTAFFAGITVGQVSEFSLILIALGTKLGHVSPEVTSLITLIAIITIAFSSYGIMHAEKAYTWLSGLLAWFDFTGGSAEHHQKESELKHHIVLLGVHRTGKELAESFLKQREKFVIVDFNPDVAEHYARQGVQVICGDASDPYIQDLAGFRHARMIVSTLPELHDNLGVVESVRNQKIKAKLIIMAQNEEDARALYKHKVDYVLLPHYINGLHLSKILKHPNPHQHLTSLRTQHLRALGA